jgi:hypothetical protein
MKTKMSQAHLCSNIKEVLALSLRILNHLKWMLMLTSEIVLKQWSCKVKLLSVASSLRGHLIKEMRVIKLDKVY